MRLGYSLLFEKSEPKNESNKKEETTIQIDGRQISQLNLQHIPAGSFRSKIRPRHCALASRHYKLSRSAIKIRLKKNKKRTADNRGETKLFYAEIYEPNAVFDSFICECFVNRYVLTISQWC
jgi:hypothetical protein